MSNLAQGATEFIFGDSDKFTKPLRNFEPFGGSLPGLDIQAGRGGFNLTRTPELQSALGGLSGAFRTQAEELGGLRPLVAPGFGRLTEAGRRAIENARSRTVSNLREDLRKRRVLGSSFAQDKVTQTELDFAQQQEEFESQAFLQELGLTQQLINQEAQANVNQFKSILEQGNFETEIGTRLMTQATATLGDLAKFQASLLADFAAARGAVVRTGLETLFGSGGLLGGLFGGGGSGGLLGNLPSLLDKGISAIGGGLIDAGGDIVGGISDIFTGGGAFTNLAGELPFSGGLDNPFSNPFIGGPNKIGGFDGAGQAASTTGLNPFGLPGLVAGGLAAKEFSKIAEGITGQVGSGLGTLAGTAGGPIGMAAGSIAGSIIGNIVGDIFGLGDSPPDFDIIQQTGTSNFESNDFISTPFGNIGFFAPHTRDLTSRDGKKMLQALQPIVEFDTALAPTLTGDEFSKIRKELDGFQIGNAHQNPSSIPGQLFKARLDSVVKNLSPARLEQTGMRKFIEDYNANLEQEINPDKELFDSAKQAMSDISKMQRELQLLGADDGFITRTKDRRRAQEMQREIARLEQDPEIGPLIQEVRSFMAEMDEGGGRHEERLSKLTASEVMDRIFKKRLSEFNSRVVTLPT